MAGQSSGTPQRLARTRVVALILVGLGFILSGLALAASVISNGRPSPLIPDGSAIPVSVSFNPPEITLADIHGQPASLSDYAGQIVLVNNWATWCPPCKAEMPTLQAYFQDHQADGFTIVAIESGDPGSEVASYVEQNGLTFPVWVDEYEQATLAFRNNGLPSSYLIDRNGVVRLAWNGAISREMLEKYVTPLVED